MKQVIAWLADSNGTGGQAAVTSEVISVILETLARVYTIQYAKSGRNKFFCYMSSIVILVAKISNRSLIYFTPSRSVLGALRDVPVYFCSLFVKVIAHVHGDDLDTLLSRGMLGRLLLKFYKRIELVVVPTIVVKAKLEKLGLTNVFVVENYSLNIPVDPEAITSSVTERYVWNSNIISTKGFFEFAEAYRLLPVPYRLPVDIFGEVIGSKMLSRLDTEKEFFKISKELGFFYRGVLPRAELVLEISSRDLVVLPSYGECQPLAVIDAMVQGAALVLSDWDSMQDVSKGYANVTFTQISPHCIVKALMHAVDRQHSNTGLSNDMKAARKRFCLLRFRREIAGLFE